MPRCLSLIPPPIDLDNIILGRSARYWLYNVGPTLICRAGQPCQRQANGEPTFGQHLGNVGLTFGRCWANVFCQHFPNVLGNRLPPFFQPFTNIWLLIFTYDIPQIKFNFDVLTVSRKCHISRHVLVHALKQDIPNDTLKTSG